jgi:ABC-type Mn2+/Zn2+ transport system permease subunit
MLAVGVVIVSRSAAYFGELTAFLFGNLLGVDGQDLWIEGIATLVVVVGGVLLYRPFLVLCFNEDKAALYGLRPGPTNLAMLGLIALAVVASYRAVGTLLVSALLIAPPATASLVTRRVPALMALAVALGISSVVAGLVVSYHHDTAAGATVAAVAVGEFFLVAMVRGLRRAVTERAVAAEAA